MKRTRRMPVPFRRAFALPPRVTPPQAVHSPTRLRKPRTRNQEKRDDGSRDRDRPCDLGSSWKASGPASASSTTRQATEPWIAPSGIRTRATTLKGWRPGPLVDGGGRSEDTRGRSYHPWPPGRLAQLVERLPYTQVAAGSSPAPPISTPLPMRKRLETVGHACEGPHLAKPCGPRCGPRNLPSGRV